MAGSSFFVDVVSGRQRGLIAASARAVFWLLSGPYRIVIAVRNAYYNVFGFAARRIGRPVISIGNITVGGTGKTPMTAKVANLLVERGERVAILSRGYKGSSIPFDEARCEQAAAQLSAESDEARVLKRRCPRVQVCLHADRVSSGRIAIDEGATVLVLDDGFQHRRMARDLDIVLVDATAPFGYGRMLPAGLLREPLSSLQRANLIVLTRSDEVDVPARAEILRRIAQVSRGRPIVQAVQRIAGFVDVKGRPVADVESASMQAVIFAGIANFVSFRRCVERLGVRVLAAYEYPDHHYYTAEEIEGLIEVATSREANVLLTTEKDAVKLVGRWNDRECRLLALNLEIEFEGDGDRILADAIAEVTRRGITHGEAIQTG